jgi:hypothetical protein
MDQTQGVADKEVDLGYQVQQELAKAQALSLAAAAISAVAAAAAAVPKRATKKAAGGWREDVLVRAAAEGWEGHTPWGESPLLLTQTATDSKAACDRLPGKSRQQRFSSIAVCWGDQGSRTSA